jgi:hypothetical protein
LLAVSVSRRSDADTFVASDPLKDLAQQEFEEEAAAEQSRPEIRMAFNNEREQVIFEAWPPLSGAGYLLLNELRSEYEAAKRGGIAPENYPFVSSHQLADRLNIEEPTVRRRISRLRQQLARYSVGDPLPPDAVIENEPWRGYRLNPSVLVLAVSELCPNCRVISVEQ